MKLSKNKKIKIHCKREKISNPRSSGPHLSGQLCAFTFVMYVPSPEGLVQDKAQPCASHPARPLLLLTYCPVCHCALPGSVCGSFGPLPDNIYAFEFSAVETGRHIAEVKGPSLSHCTKWS